MTLTDKERAAMVAEIKVLAAKHKRWYSAYGIEYDKSMALNYEALAQTLAERKPFEAVA